MLKSDSKQDVPVLCLTSTLVFNEPPLKTPKSFFDAENVVTFDPLSQKNVCKIVRKWDAINSSILIKLTSFMEHLNPQTDIITKASSFRFLLFWHKFSVPLKITMSFLRIVTTAFNEHGQS